MNLTSALFGRRTQAISDVPARLALGASMMYHGLAKLRGEGPAQAAGYFESIGIRPGRFWAVATGVAETASGAAAILGIATRPAAIAVLVTQGFAVMKVHRPKGFDFMQGGMEYNLALMSMALGLLATGAGPVSTHGLLRRATTRRRIARTPWRFARPSALERGLDLIH